MELVKGRYQIQGVDLQKITSEFGTPVYVYDASKIEEQYQRMHNAFKGLNVKIKYAAKALTNISVLKLLNKLGSGLDAVSIGEVRLGLKAGFSPQDILFTPNCVSFSEIKEAIKLEVRITIDNTSILEQFGNEFGDSLPICIRINPHILAGGHHKISTGHIDSKFGISIHQTRHVQRIIQTYDIRVEGLHMHTGSDILDAEVFLNGAQLLVDVAKEFKDLNYIDFGSGFKVAYREGDVATDVENFGKKLGEAFKGFTSEYGKEVEIWFEPGKFITSEAGLLLVRTNVIKTTPATVFAGVDSGMNHMIRPMMYDSYHDMVNISNPKGIPRIYSVVGYICETDTLGWDRKLNDVREGDIIAIKNAGAYGFSMSSNYNSRERPAEVMVINGEARLIRRREDIDDLLRNMVEINID